MVSSNKKSPVWGIFLCVYFYFVVCMDCVKYSYSLSLYGFHSLDTCVCGAFLTIRLRVFYTWLIYSLSPRKVQTSPGKGACFHLLSARTDGSRPTQVKIKIPKRGFCIFGGPGRTRTDTPCRT